MAWRKAGMGKLVVSCLALALSFSLAPVVGLAAESDMGLDESAGNAASQRQAAISGEAEGVIDGVSSPLPPQGDSGADVEDPRDGAISDMNSGTVAGSNKEQREADGSGASGSAEQKKSGWVTEEAGHHKLYYGQDGNPVTGAQKIDGLLYLFDAQGHLITGGGWHEQDGQWYFVAGDASDTLATGWLKVGNAWYWFDSDTGAMKTGWFEADGARYFSDASGAMRTGWLLQDGSWYYLTGSGAMAEGWAWVGGAWYYLAPGSGAMRTGWLLDGGAWYYLTGSGAMATGWAWVNGSWYYLTGSGAMAEGWAWAGGAWYYLTPGSGAMVTGWQWLDGCWNAFDKVSGVWRTNNAMLVNGWYTAQRVSSPTNYFILVDDANTKVMVYYWNVNEWMPLYIFDCATGAPRTRTVHGTFSVGSRGYSFGHGYTCYYWTQFYGNYLFHSTLYQQGSFQPMDARLNDHLSHGCVRMAIGNAKWIYDNIPYGTRVVVY